MRRSRLPNIWRGMLSRCYDLRSRSYPGYGGRGITVCARWRHSFAAFANDMGEPPSANHSIDRVDNNIGYSPKNCRWATKKEQARNTRRNRIITIDGVSKPISAWAEISGIDPRLIRWRLELGWTQKKAVFGPPTVPGLNPRKGMDHHKAILTDKDVLAIRTEFRPGHGGNVQELARRFGVSRDSIRNIGLRKSWRHL